MNKQEMKDLVCRKVDEYKDMIEGIATYLHEHPELGMKEVLAAAYLRQVLQEQGFAVSDVLPDKFPTAFHAVKGQGGSFGDLNNGGHRTHLFSILRYYNSEIKSSEILNICREFSKRRE